MIEFQSELQKEIMAKLGTSSKIDPSHQVTFRIEFLKEYCKAVKAKGFILGISGGQDSTLAGKLAQMAVTELRKEGYPAKFIALRLPYGQQKDESDAQLALQYIQPDESLTFNIESSVNAFAADFPSAAKKQLSDFHKGNVKARMRMIAQYAIAGENNLLVIGTDHAAEAVTGFFTKFGDGGADILPLSSLTKNQGKDLLICLDAPRELYTKAPTADLLDEAPQQKDESELGLTYSKIDSYLTGEKNNPETSKAIEERYMATRHKRELPVSPTDTWWR